MKMLNENLGCEVSMRPRQVTQLVMATGAFFVCYAIFGSVAAMMPLLSERMKLTTAQVSFAVAVPVLLGSIARVPLGILADHWGGRLVHLLVMAIAIPPALLLGVASSYWQLIVCGLLIGFPLAIFPVGVSFISNWYPSHQRGTAVGFMALGSIGQSFALFGAPLLAAWIGFRWGFWMFGLLLVAWLFLFAGFAQNARRSGEGQRLADLIRPLRQPVSWTFCVFYFLTLGSFLTLSSFLPSFLTVEFGLQKADAGFRAAGFVAA